MATASSVPIDKTDDGELCLVAIGRLQPTSMPTSKDLADSAPATEFITRQTLDGRFSFVDQRSVETHKKKPLYSVRSFSCHLNVYKQTVRRKGYKLYVIFNIYLPICQL